MPLSIVSYYKFVALPDAAQLREQLLALCEKLGLKGTILIAEEGINSSLSGPKAALEAFFTELEKDARFQGMPKIWQVVEAVPFKRMFVKHKPEIVKMNQPMPATSPRGTYLEAAEWDALLNDPEVVVIDTRNDFEVQMGSFKGAINPRTESFHEFPEWAATHLDPEKHKKVAMFCTGGIRCEKSTAYLKAQGFAEVYHLKGGILTYLEQGNQNGKWQGECFVFDERRTAGF